MKVLLSIKPEFVERIFDGSKKYEYRKMLFKRNDINVVVIYASAPVKRVVGEFRIKDIFSESVDVLWERTKNILVYRENIICHISNIKILQMQ